MMCIYIMSSSLPDEVFDNTSIVPGTKLVTVFSLFGYISFGIFLMHSLCTNIHLTRDSIKISISCYKIQMLQ